MDTIDEKANALRSLYKVGELTRAELIEALDRLDTDAAIAEHGL